MMNAEPVLEGCEVCLSQKNTKRDRPNDWNSTQHVCESFLKARKEELACCTTLPSQDRGEEVHKLSKASEDALPLKRVG